LRSRIKWLVNGKGTCSVLKEGRLISRPGVSIFKYHTEKAEDNKL